MYYLRLSKTYVSSNDKQFMSNIKTKTVYREIVPICKNTWLKSTSFKSAISVYFIYQNLIEMLPNKSDIAVKDAGEKNIQNIRCIDEKKEVQWSNKITAHNVINLNESKLKSYETNDGGK